MRGLRKVNVFLSDHIPDGGKPGIELVRNPGLRNAGPCDHCCPGRDLDVSVGIPLWMNGYGPSLGLVGWPSGGSTPKILSWKCGNRRNTTHTDTILVPNLSNVDELRALKRKEND